MKHICHNCFEIIEGTSCPKCGFVNEELNSELYANARMAVRYGYSYRKIAQKNGNSNLHHCLPEANEILIWLANAILSGIAWDVIKTTVSKLRASIKNRTSVDAETRQVLSDDDELAKFYEYIKDYERGFSSINENEYKYIEEEMIADFYAEKETEIFNNKKRLPTIEERIEILKSVKIKIKTIVKREFDK